MRYRSFVDLSRTVQDNLHRIPRDVDLVVGVPRSGLLPASMVALALNLPLADIDGFVAGRMLSAGNTRRRGLFDQSIEEFRRILVVDDSVRTGGSMREARAKLADLPRQERLMFCAIYGDGDVHIDADLVLEAVPEPRIFQWNLMHHSIVSKSCFDIDGVLCFDPSHHDNDDGERYLAFLNEARPLMTPTHRLGHLVTSRLERYRPQTEAWLAAQGIEYDRLWMLDLPSAEERRKAGAHGRFKAEVYSKLDAVLFIESEERQAIEIARLSGKPVLSIESHSIIDPSRPAELLRRFERQAQRLKLRRRQERLYRLLREVRRSVRLRLRG